MWSLCLKPRFYPPKLPDKLTYKAIIIGKSCKGLTPLVRERRHDLGIKFTRETVTVRNVSAHLKNGRTHGPKLERRRMSRFRHSSIAVDASESPFEGIRLASPS
jgi:hypothetical protein